MFTMFANSTRMAVSTVAAVAVVSFSALVLDQGHIAAAPRGTVEIGELTPVETMPMASVTLPEVVVVAKRESRADAFLAAAQLPEIVVTAKRIAYQVAQGAESASTSGVKSPSGAQASSEGALLK